MPSLDAPITLAPAHARLLATSVASTSDQAILRFIFGWLTDLDSRLTAAESAASDIEARVTTAEQAATSMRTATEAAFFGVSSALNSVTSALARADAANTVLADRLTSLEQKLLPGPAASLRVVVQAKGATTMSTTTLSVDVANEEVAASWVDDKGEATDQIPAGATIAFASSAPTIVSVGTAVADATGAKAPLSFLLAGTADVTATAIDATGAALPGFTAGTTNLVLTPGAAASLQVSVDAAPAVAAPTA